MTFAHKDAPISPSLQCLCAMRKLLPLVSSRRPAGWRAARGLADRWEQAFEALLDTA